MAVILQGDHLPAELMFSMTFLSSAERLTIVVTKARHLRLNDDAKSVPSRCSTFVHSQLNSRPIAVYAKSFHLLGRLFD